MCGWAPTSSRDRSSHLASEPGKEALTRAIAQAAYAAGAKFVDLCVFDVYLKRARALHADRDTLGYVPPWIGERVVALGEQRAARIALSGPGRRPMPSTTSIRADRPGHAAAGRGVDEGHQRRHDQLDDRPRPTAAWATLVHPRLEPAAALERLWEEVGHICRLDEPDPVAAWESRLCELTGSAARSTSCGLDALRFAGPEPI